MLKIGIYTDLRKTSYDILSKIAKDSKYAYVPTSYGGKVRDVKYYVVNALSYGLKLDQIITDKKHDDYIDLSLISSLLSESCVPYQLLIIRLDKDNYDI